MDPSSYQIVEPIPQLQPYIRRILVADNQDSICESIRPGPTGYNYLGWFFGGITKAYIDQKLHCAPSNLKIHVSGQIKFQNIEMRHSGRFGHIIAECSATGFYELTGVPGERIHGVLDHLEVFSPKLAAPIDRVLNSVTDKSETIDRATPRLDIFQQQLLTLTQHTFKIPTYITDTVKEIEREDGAVKVSDIVDQYSVSSRQVRRKFKEIVGITPKYFAKVLQLNKVLFALYSNQQDTLATLALDAGFYDHSHFTNVMQQFFANTPYDFLKSSEPLLSTFLGKSRNL